RLVRLPGAAAVLADRPEGAKLRGTAAVVVGRESQGPARRAGPLCDQGRAGGRAVAQGRDPDADRHDPRTAGSRGLRAVLLQDAAAGQRPDPGAAAAPARARADATVAVARRNGAAGTGGRTGARRPR